MKKYKLIINIILIVVIVFSVISLFLIVPTLIDYIKDFDYAKSVVPTDDASMKNLMSFILELLFSLTFSVLSALTSIIVFLLLNFNFKKLNSNQT